MKRKSSNKESKIPVKKKLEKAENGQDEVEDCAGHIDASNGEFTFSQDELHKPPTTDELNMLRETENLFHSSLFRLQIEELLSETKLKRYVSMERWIEEFVEVLEELPDDEQKWSLHDGKLADSKGIKMPLSLREDDCDGSYRFIKPSSVAAVGSFALKIASRRNCVVDLVVEIPLKCIHRKTDFLNHRYHRKRALYLVSIAALIRNNALVGNLKFTYFGNDSMKPALLVTPSGDLGKRYRVQILPCLPPEVVKVSRLKPSACNLKSDTAESPFPTPCYNSSILVDARMMPNFQFLSETLKDDEAVVDGLRLLNIWLHQRELDSGYGCFGSFIMAMYVSYLLKSKKLNPMMSSYQVLRNTLVNLEKSDWTTRGISLAIPRKGQPNLEEFHREFEVVFVDPSGFHNICANMSTKTYKLIIHECKLSLSALDNQVMDSFAATLMLPAPFMNKFDSLVHLKFDDEWASKNIEKWSLDRKVSDLSGRKILAVLPKITEYLEHGLGRRVSIIGTKLFDAVEWTLDESVPESTDNFKITFGFILNPEFSSSVLDKGPSADQPEAKEFQSFWGDKSELRRFQDASICEAVLWPGKTVAERRLVCKSVVEFVLKRHMMIPARCLKYVGGQLDPLLSSPKYESGTGEEENLKIHQVYDTFTKELRILPDLPLSINSVLGVSPIFSYTEVFPPVPYRGKVESLKRKDGHFLLPEIPESCPEHLLPLQVLLEMEASGKWPKEYEAFTRVKTAFYIQLAKVLRAQHRLPVLASAEALHVMKEGYVFKLQIASKREINCLKQIKAADGKILTKDSDESRQMETSFFVLPKIRSVLHGLQTQNVNFSSACRLAKRWIGAQLMADHFPDICVELLVAFVFVCPAPFTVPNCPQVAFTRFLRLLAKFDWRSNALIVNFNNELKKEDISEIQNRLISSRQELPPLYISTPYDKFKSVFTSQSPTVQILHRVVLLADKALSTLQSQLSGFGEHDYKTIFRPPMETFDVIIRLKSCQVPNRHESVDYKFKDVDRERTSVNYVWKRLPIVGFNPVESYLKELKDTYGDIALFFHDKYGGDFIAVLWKPQAFEPTPFKVQNLNYRMVIRGGDPKDPKTIPNVEVVLDDFSVLGKDVVQNIETTTDRWVIS